jgi:type III pantothenate kinase
MILAIDIGNSNIVLGVHENDNWRKIWRVDTDSDRTILFYQQFLMDVLLEEGVSSKDIQAVVFSSVVPDLNEKFKDLLNHLYHQAKITILNPELYFQLGLKVARPYEIGSDLVANAVAAHHHYKCNAIVIDFGTALSFTIINKEGHILGVNIAPGLKTAIRSLSKGTAQLPEVLLEYPKSAVGTNTNHAIQSGVLVGYVGLVRYMIEEIRKELGADFKTIATGGLSHVLAPLQNDFDFQNPNLTLEGLRILS